MNCIDAVEGSVKSIISELYRVYVEYNLDDTEYIRNVKTIIDGTDFFIQENREIVTEPQILKDVLYGFSKGLWMEGLKEDVLQASFSKQADSVLEGKEYLDYYFDHIYGQGDYPR